MNCQKLFQDFNSSKFVVYTSLLFFFVLFALRLDNTIHISWWLVFTPLWVWKSLVIIGALVGVIVWVCNPECRLSESSYTHFKSMLISLSLQLLLLMFELLVCDKLESGRHFWTLAFIPLIFISLLSVAVSVWALKNERDFELELFCSVNVLQFIFIALRLDKFITWSWVVVFVPLWILLCLAIIGVLYSLIFAVILFRTPDVTAEQRRASFHTAIGYTLVVLPLLIFFVLLSSKLDTVHVSEFHNDPALVVNNVNMIHLYSPHISHTVSAMMNQHQQSSSPFSTPLPFFTTVPYHFDLDYFSVCIPLYFTLSILIVMSFNSKGGNLWWFGMRKDFCSFMLILCPCLREYANISYNFNLNNFTSGGGQQNERTNLTAVQVANNYDYDATDGPSCKTKGKFKKVVTAQPNAVIVPHLHLDAPD